MATLGMTAADKTAVEAFRRDVVDPSMTNLVIIDFWAEWCGPCKALGPVLEKVAADYADSGVLLAKIDVDANGFIASQFQVRSIPTVYAMFQGQLVADLTPARTESQLTQMIDQLLQQLPVTGNAPEPQVDLDPMIAMGEEVLATGDGARALAIFDQIADIAPDHPAIPSGRIRALVALGEMEAAEAAIAALPDDAAKAPAIERAKAAIALAKDATPASELDALAARVAADPGDHDARFRLANGLMAAGDRDGAADALLTIIAAERDWNEGAARQQLLKLFEVVGIADPWVSAQRRRLSATLFG